MKKNYLLAVILFLTSLLVLQFLPISSQPASVGQEGALPCQRIISLSPSNTEILYALGLGERIVGVTRYCKYPAAALAKPRIGALVDFSVEEVLRLNPDTVVSTIYNERQVPQLKQRGIFDIPLRIQSVMDVPRAYKQISAACQLPQAIDQAIAFETAFDQLSQATQNTKPPRVLVIYQREGGMGSINQFYAAGNDFYNDLLQRIHAVNAYQGDIAVPTLSRESVLRMNPDIIIEVYPSLQGKDKQVEAMLADWQSLPELTAVKDKRIYLLTDDYLVISGPRLIDAAKTLAQIIYQKPFK